MTNRLASESSPYLRQHADNPVDWYPWGDEAFARARAEDRPVLISVGYSSCHWCHVMAHESFEDPDTAAVMNELFVNVKVDREERPDVDAVYMEAVQAMTGNGGWPMTVFATPDGRPFLAGTYFPRHPRAGMPSFTELCGRIDELWRTRRSDLEDQANGITEAIGQSAGLAPGTDLPGADLLDGAVAVLATQFDSRWGGFGTIPKFPQAMSLDLLVRHHLRTGDAPALEMVTASLDAMAAGGIYDHLGGGFARYSTDEEWLVPHFEKMLYDQALLVRAYLHAWQVTGEARHLQVIEETIGYVLAELTQPGGGFASAEDADSLDADGHSTEGAYYVWTELQFRSALEAAGFQPSEIDHAARWWGVTADGNFEGATNVLHRPERGALARPEVIERTRLALFDARRRTRERPGLDDKVLTEWNALFLSSLAEAAAATGRQDWRDAAVACGEFLLAHLRRPDGRWLRSWQGDDVATGSARHLAYAADHAALVDAFVRMGELTGQARWMAEADRTARSMLELFEDDANGGLFTTGTDAEALVTRPKDLMDNATPSANSLAAMGLVRLAALTGDESLRAPAEKILALLAPLAERHPNAFGHLLCTVDLVAHGVTEVVISGDRPDLVAAVRERFRPDVVLAWGEPFDGPLWEGRHETGPQGRAYVCRGYVCAAPVSEVAALDQVLTTG